MDQKVHLVWKICFWLQLMTHLCYFMSFIVRTLHYFWYHQQCACHVHNFVQRVILMVNVKRVLPITLYYQQITHVYQQHQDRQILQSTITKPFLIIQTLPIILQSKTTTAQTPIQIHNPSPSNNNNSLRHINKS